MLTIDAVCPQSPPSAEAVALVCASDPWAWTLDSMLAAIGLGIAGVGAIATALIAWWALKATTRANQLQRASQERGDRLAFVGAVEDYLDFWVQTGGAQDADKRVTAEARLNAQAAGASSGAENVAAWIIQALREAKDQVAADHKVNVALGELGGRALTSYGPNEVRRRVSDWVATGDLDDSPLLHPLPEPPPFPFDR
ncbi:hypothetical protein [Microbacterium sp. NPDC055357]